MPKFHVYFKWRLAIAIRLRSKTRSYDVISWLYFNVQNGPERLWGPPSLLSGALSLGVKRPGREADHSPPSNAEVKE